MFRTSESCFNLSSQTRQDLEDAAHAPKADADPEERDGVPSPTGLQARELFRRRARLSTAKEKLLKAAKAYKAQTDWSGFEPSQPEMGTKLIYDVASDDWIEESVMVEIDSKPFGHGALRECFRMREVPMKTPKHHDGTPTRRISQESHLSMTSQTTLTSQTGTTSVKDDSDEDGTPVEPTKSEVLREVLSARVKLNSSTKRRCWVAKRSTKGHTDIKQHKLDCMADAALQQVAKHHAEAFNKARRNLENVPKHVSMHEVDFLMAHVLELPDGSTYGVEAFVFGHYEKFNNNSGGVMKTKDWVTPQAFSYFTFVTSGFCQMVVDIQGVDDLFTDPVLHFLPEHNKTLAALGDQSVNLGVRGFALFLWSHRRNPVDALLGLPTFPHAVYEQRAVGSAGGLTVAHMATVAKTAIKPSLKRAETTPTNKTMKVELAGVPGVNLQPKAWGNVRVNKEAASPEGFALPQDMVIAACHMELAVMYNDGRIGEGIEKQLEIEAAVFHLVLAAQQGLPEAMLALARICSGLGHEDFLPEVECGAEDGALCLLLLEKVAEAPCCASARAARGALAGLLASGALGDVDSLSAAKHYEAFAEAAAGCDGDAADSREEESDSKRPVRGLEVSSCYGDTFDWEDHGLEVHSAYARAAEIYAAQPGNENKAEAKRLWEAASEAAMEDPRLAKQAMRYMEHAEAAENEDEDQEECCDDKTESQPAELHIPDVAPAVLEEFRQFSADLGISPADALAELLRRAAEAQSKAVSAAPAEPDYKPAAKVEELDEDVWAMLG